MSTHHSHHPQSHVPGVLVAEEEILIAQGGEIVLIDIEVFARERRPLPPHHPRHRYRIRIDTTYHEVTGDHRTGRQLLELAKKTPPERFRIFQKLAGGASKTVTLDEVVYFTAPGVERFVTLPLDQTEG